MATEDRRRLVRELAMQALCQLDVQGDAALPILGDFMVEQTDDASVRQMALEWAQKIWQRLAECDKYISQAAVRWSLSRMSMVDRAILRLSMWQLLYCPDIPPKVVMNEAIEIAKKYGLEQSPRFVNGVLDAAYKILVAKTTALTDSAGHSSEIV